MHTVTIILDKPTLKTYGISSEMMTDLLWSCNLAGLTEDSMTVKVAVTLENVSKVMAVLVDHGVHTH